MMSRVGMDDGVDRLDDEIEISEVRYRWDLRWRQW